MTYPHGPREGAHKTIRLEDQPLPDREASFYTPRSGDWLLLAVLVVALLGIGVRVWAQLGWGDQVGQAIFFGLLLLAIYWTALIYTFKLSLAMRVGPQGLAIVRGPWRVELRWSEITRLMERPQSVGGRRYRWVVALARDGRRIQVREDALLDYERFRREVYERYRLWRDHGGTWGATGGGPFVAKETVAEEARWWALVAFLIALPGFYLALFFPATHLAGYALLLLALLCVGMVARVFLRRRAYALDGRMIESRGLLERIQLAWRDVSKVERTRHAASGVILAVVAVGRLALRLAARGDAGIRGFAWSPRVPEYLTLRGGGRHARIRLHHLAQPEELVAWVEFYTGLRRAGSSRPLESAAAGAPRRAGASRPLEPSVTGAPRHAGADPGPLEAATAAIVGDIYEQAPDLSDVSGPVDPWGGARRGEPAQAEPESPREPVSEPVFRGAPLGASFREPDGLDLPPDAADGADDADEAWLRETNALFSMSGGAPAPEAPRPANPIADAQTVATPAPPPATPAAPRARQFVPPPGPSHAPRRPPTAAPPPGAPFAPPPSAPPPPRPATFAPPLAPRSTPLPRQESPFAPYNPDAPDEEFVAAPAPPMAPAPAPAPAPVARWDTPSAPYESGPARPPSRAELDAELDMRDAGDGDGEDYEDGAEEDVDVPAPWRNADWQPPVLPRFGPQNTQPAEDYPPRRDGRQTDR